MNKYYKQVEFQIKFLIYLQLFFNHLDLWLTVEYPKPFIHSNPKTKNFPCGDDYAKLS